MQLLNRDGKAALTVCQVASRTEAALWSNVMLTVQTASLLQAYRGAVQHMQSLVNLSHFDSSTRLV